MECLKQRIREQGQVLSGDIVKVDGFLNHRLDVPLIEAIAEDFAAQYQKSGATIVMTIEAGGIAVAFALAQRLGLPMLFAKKGQAKNIGSNVYSADVYSYTRGSTYGVYVSKRYLQAEDKVLIVDDFLANGQAALGLVSICEQAGAEVVGIAIVIEKQWQRGSELLRQRQLPLYSAAIIQSIQKGQVVFAGEEHSKPHSDQQTEQER